MSSYELRDRLRRDIERQVKEESGLLANRATDPLDTMRYRQGVIRGLAMASELLDTAYKEIS